MMTKLVFAFLILLGLAGCSSWRPSIDGSNLIEKLQPYHVEVQQGNLLKQEQVSMLKPGMTPAQVRFLLGTPLLVDPFREDRWDYSYILRRGGDVLERRHITVVFEDGKLARILGDVVPSAAKPGEGAADTAPAPAEPAPEKPAEAAAP